MSHGSTRGHARVTWPPVGRLPAALNWNSTLFHNLQTALGSRAQLALPGLACALALACSPKESQTDREALNEWLLCEECTEGELHRLRLAGDRLVPPLAQVLNGSSIGRLDDARRQLEDTYQHLAARAASEGRTLPLTRDQYVSHFLSNYKATLQSRAIRGLDAIGTPAADSALARARERARVGAVTYRPDVLTELVEAAPGEWGSVSAGAFRSCGVRTNGTAYCWGRNEFGQLGDGTTDARLIPTPVAGNLRFDSIGAGSRSLWHTCGIVLGGRAHCWGRNANGQLGDGTTANRPAPTPVAGGHQFVGITTGGEHTCAWTAAGRGYCWGWNNSGQLGDGLADDRLEPFGLPSFFGFRGMSAGAFHTCADSLNGDVF